MSVYGKYYFYYSIVYYCRLLIIIVTILRDKFRHKVKMLYQAVVDAIRLH